MIENYHEEIERVEELTEEQPLTIKNLGSWGYNKGIIKLSYDEPDSHLRFMTEVILNPMRELGWIVWNIDTSGVIFRHESCHQPENYLDVMLGD